MAMRAVQDAGESGLPRPDRGRLAISLRAGGALVVSAVSAMVGYPPGMLMALVPAIHLAGPYRRLRGMLASRPRAPRR